jgi:hypothetical protein
MVGRSLGGGLFSILTTRSQRHTGDPHALRDCEWRACRLRRDTPSKSHPASTPKRYCYRMTILTTPRFYRQMPFMSTAEWESRYSSNPLLWWADTGHTMFPRLAMMARDYYATQRKPSLYSICHKGMCDGDTERWSRTSTTSTDAG